MKKLFFPAFLLSLFVWPAFAQTTSAPTAIGLSFAFNTNSPAGKTNGAFAFNTTGPIGKTNGAFAFNTTGPIGKTNGAADFATNAPSGIPLFTITTNYTLTISGTTSGDFNGVYTNLPNWYHGQPQFTRDATQVLSWGSSDRWVLDSTYSHNGSTEIYATPNSKPGYINLPGNTGWYRNAGGTNVPTVVATETYTTNSLFN